LQPILFYFTAEGAAISTRYISSLPFWVFIGTIKIPIGTSLGGLFLFLWGAFVVSFGLAWKSRKDFYKVVKKNVTRPIGRLFKSSLFAMPVLNSMTLVAVIALQSLQEAGGIPTGSSPLPGTPFLDLVDLSYAAVVEEASFRILPIGAFVIIYLFVTARRIEPFPFTEKVKLLFTSVLVPEKAKRMVGAKTVEDDGILRGISLGEWGMVAFTTVFFGLAHYAPGVSWEVGKITSAAFAGLVIALCYLVYGAHAAVIMHWFFNVYIEVYNIFADYYPIASPAVYAIWMATLFLGFMGWLVMLRLWFGKIFGLRRKRENRKTDFVESFTISPQ
jgi:hypothetical protein